jgi:hypothetical protein
MTQIKRIYTDLRFAALMINRNADDTDKADLHGF